MVIGERRMTLAEFLELSEQKPALEYDEDGTVTRKVSPKGQHSTVQTLFAGAFNQVAVPRKLAVAFAELRVSFAGVSRVPDVSIFRWDRIPRTAAGDVENDFQEPPDVALEIISPRQGVNKLIRRCLWYVANGVPLALLADPEDRSVIRFQPGAQPVALRGADVLDFSLAAPGFSLTVDEFFGLMRLV